MARSLDMNLDHLIRDGAAPAPAPPRRNRTSHFRTNANRLSPYSYSKFQKAPDSPWEHDLYTPHMDPVVVGVGPFHFQPPVEGSSSPIELIAGTKLLVSNLDYGVTDEDIQELFSVVGQINHYSINYDRSGRSEGTAQVVFARHADALAAVKRYNSVLLDGKPMQIEIVGTNLKAPLPPVVTPLPYARVPGNLKASMRSRGFGGRRGLPGGGGFGAEARYRGQGGNFNGGRGGGGSKVKRKEQVSVSAADLDADLDRYHASAKQTI
ncbi:hypothetical protein LUZ61_013137 [Rhynchospora tenuis]|uniref:RRM domain-containing protein n=1 Tax=Rhynchospora tenuis TaxID=198213 RepID=A0AAD5WBF2_9POAL|nr:hypothetical protein LUZ61_013137 [Rhynchospora tenuis]